MSAGSNEPSSIGSAASRAERFLEAARKAQVNQSGRAFHRAMGKTTLVKQGRKPRRMG